MKNSFMPLFQFLIVPLIPQLLENKNQKLTLLCPNVNAVWFVVA